jgi:hypothetical protein
VARDAGIGYRTVQRARLAREPIQREAAYKLKQIEIRDAKHQENLFVTHAAIISSFEPHPVTFSVEIADRN